MLIEDDLMNRDIDRAPRFTAYFQHYKNRPVLKMSRISWEKMNKNGSGIIAIKLEHTPIINIKNDTQVLKSIITSHSAWSHTMQRSL
jgi:hypothetical protein